MKNAIIGILIGITMTACMGKRESLRPYLGLESMSCDEIRLEMMAFADAIDKRALINTGVDLLEAGATAAIYAGNAPPAAIAVPMVLSELNFPDQQYREAIRFRANVALQRGCELPESLMEVEG